MSQRIMTKALLLTATPKAKAAARFMYGVGVVAAIERKRIAYSAVAAGLQAMKLDYTYRSLGTALDALAAYCDELKVPDLSAIYEPKQTGTPGR